MLKWQKKVRQELIARLYNQSASGIIDDDLADEVGCALYARCESIVSVTNGYERNCLQCPKCGADVPLTENAFNCACGFHATWEEFRSSHKGKQLYAANALPIFVDTEVNRPTGANLIEGSLSEVIQFLNKLSSIEGYSQGKNRWRGIIERANGGNVLKP